MNRGSRTHCGCKTRELQSIQKRKKYGESLKNRVIDYYKGNARKRNLEFNLKNEEMIKLMDGNCYYCGIEPFNIMKHKNSYGEIKYNGIDRLDSSKGYIKGNVVSCCKRCNRMKNTYTEKEFLLIIKNIYEYSKLHNVNFNILE